MSIGGHDFEVLAEVFLDGLRLGGRFYDYEILAHLLDQQPFSDRQNKPRDMPRPKKADFRLLSVDQAGVLLENQIFHACVCGLLARLAEQHHQHDPLDLFDVDLVIVQRH